MVSATEKSYLSQYKVFLATEEVITATWKYLNYYKTYIDH